MKKDITIVFSPSWSVISPPVVLAYLATFLKEKKFKVNVYDANIKLYNKLWTVNKDLWHPSNRGHFSNHDAIKKLFSEYNNQIEDIVDEIIELDSLVYGFNIMEHNKYFVIEIIKKLKKKKKDAKILLGGDGCYFELSRRPIEEHLKGDILGMVIGEAEETLVEILSKIRKNESLDGVKGFHIIGEKISLREQIKDINSLPFPRYEEFDLDEYENPQELGCMWSRGCIGSCVFCEVKPLIKGFRQRKAEKIFEEIKYYFDNLAIAEFSVFDSLINANTQELEKLCDMIINSSMDVKWSAQFVPYQDLSQEFYKKLREAGCYRLEFGLESGSDKVLKKMGKIITVENAQIQLERIHKAGIITVLFVIVGFPGETDEDFINTLEFVKKNRNNIDHIQSVNELHVINYSSINTDPLRFNVCLPRHESYFQWKTGDNMNTHQVRLDRINRAVELFQSLGYDVAEDNIDEGNLLSDVYKGKGTRKKVDSIINVTSPEVSRKLKKGKVGELDFDRYDVTEDDVGSRNMALVDETVVPDDEKKINLDIDKYRSLLDVNKQLQKTVRDRDKELRKVEEQLRIVLNAKNNELKQKDIEIKKVHEEKDREAKKMLQSLEDLNLQLRTVKEGKEHEVKLKDEEIQQVHEEKDREAKKMLMVVDDLNLQLKTQKEGRAYELQSKDEEIRRMHRKVDEITIKHQQVIDRMVDDFNIEKKKHQDEIDKNSRIKDDALLRIEDEKIIFEQQKTDMEKKLRNLANENDNLQKELSMVRTRMEEAIRHKDKELRDKDQKIEQLKDDIDESIEESEERTRKKNLELDEKDMELNRLMTEKQDIEEKYSNIIMHKDDEIKNKNLTIERLSGEVQEITQNYTLQLKVRDEEIEELRQKNSEDKDKIEEMEKEIIDMKESHRQELSEKDDILNEKQRGYDDSISVISDELKEKMMEIDALNSQFNDLDERLGEFEVLQNRYTELEDALVLMKAQHEKELRQVSEQKEDEYSTNIEHLRSEMQKRFDHEAGTIKEEIGKVHAMKNEEMRNREQVFDEERKRFNEEHDLLKKTIQKLQQELSNLRSSTYDERTKILRELEKIKEELKSKDIIVHEKESSIQRLKEKNEQYRDMENLYESEIEKKNDIILYLDNRLRDILRSRPYKFLNNIHHVRKNLGLLPVTNKRK